MKTCLIYFVLFYNVFQCCCAGKISTLKAPISSVQEDDNGVTDVDVIDNSSVDPRIRKMDEELDKLYALAKENIRGKVVASTADIIENIILSNATGLLDSYPTSCPATSIAHGIYTVNVTGLEPFPVFCDTHLAGVGWTVIQRRIDGNLNFYRNWTQYKQGFGNLSSEFFIGLDKLHAITAMKPHELYIHLESFNGETRHALYDNFRISNETQFFTLESLGTYSGDAGDSLVRHLNSKFSTFDKDNDGWDNHICAEELMGAWWYGISGSHCALSSLNGLYLSEVLTYGLREKGLYWNHWHGSYRSLKSVQMMIRPQCTTTYSSY